MTERFRKTLRGEIRSSAGYGVRIMGKSGLQYSRGGQTWRFNAEVMAGSGMSVVLYADSIPHGPEMDRVEVLGDIERAFLSAGWHLLVQ